MSSGWQLRRKCRRLHRPLPLGRTSAAAILVCGVLGTLVPSPADAVPAAPSELTVTATEQCVEGSAGLTVGVDWSGVSKVPPSKVELSVSGADGFDHSEKVRLTRAQLELDDVRSGSYRHTFEGLPDEHSYEVDVKASWLRNTHSASTGPAALDCTAPETEITAAPDSVTRLTEATFELSASDPAATFSCSLDGAVPESCESPATFEVGEGPHTFSVAAVDPVGNVDQSPAAHGWTVDVTAPDTTIDAAPAERTGDPEAVFVFGSSEESGTFECSLDGESLEDCRPPLLVTVAEGDHVFAAAAVDAAGNIDLSPATHAWSVDTSPPDTRIDSAPDAYVASRDAVFAFSAVDVDGLDGFECSLDGAAFVACSSPVAYADLSEGLHDFAVRSVDVAGNADTSPATHAWHVDVTAPAAAFGVAPAGGGYAPLEVTFDATASEDGEGGSGIATYGWDLDGDGTVDSTTSDPVFTHVYETPGAVYNPRLVVTDVAGNQSQPAADWPVIVWVRPNSAPEAVDDEATTEEDAAVDVDVLADDSDPDGDPLVVTEVTEPSHGTATSDGAIVHYTPEADWSGTDTFTYTIADTEAATATGAVTVEVREANDPPVAVDDSAMTQEDTPVEIEVIVNDTDIDIDPDFGLRLVVAAVGEPAHGVVTVVDPDAGLLRYEPATDFVGIDTFTYRVSDGAATADATVTVEVTPVDDAPRPTDDVATTDEDVAVEIDPLANDSDPDGDALTIVAVDASDSDGQAAVAGGNVTYTPDPDSNRVNGAHVLTYTVSDGELTETATITIDVTPVDDVALSAVDDSVALEEDTQVGASLLTNDAPGDGIVFLEIEEKPRHGTLLCGADPDSEVFGQCVYRSDPDFAGHDTARYSIGDGDETSTASIDFTITAVDEAPLAVEDSLTAIPDVPTELDVLANDTVSDGWEATEIVAAPEHGAATPTASGSIAFSPDPGFAGTDSLTYRIVDTDGDTSGTATVSIAVAPAIEVTCDRTDGVAAPELTVACEAGAVDELGDPVGAFVWDFGDGDPASGGSEASHTFTAPGTYTGSVRTTATADVRATPLQFVVLNDTAPSTTSPTDPDTPLYDDVAFLWAGDDSPQKGVAAGTIVPERAAALSGTVRDEYGSPLTGVRVSVAGHPEYGETSSRADGRWDIAFNGGGTVTVDYRAEGHLPAQRTFEVGWGEHSAADDVRLVALDAAVTEWVQESSAYQAHVATPTTGLLALGSDGRGYRQARLLNPAGNTVQIDGDPVPAQTPLHVRATEFTRTLDGEEAMPGTLPPQSAYTYAVELSLDEAPPGSSVTFTEPVVFYVDDFIGFPVGTVAPVGTYDYETSRWDAERNGHVISVVPDADGDGKAEVDVDGDGQVNGTADIAVVGDIERGELAELYPVGAQLWRATFTSFSPKDVNWPGTCDDPNGCQNPSGPTGPHCSCDSDGDGIPDFQDGDADGDGVVDRHYDYTLNRWVRDDDEPAVTLCDEDGDGIPDAWEVDGVDDGSGDNDIDGDVVENWLDADFGCDEEPGGPEGSGTDPVEDPDICTDDIECQNQVAHLDRSVPGAPGLHLSTARQNGGAQDAPIARLSYDAPETLLSITAHMEVAGRSFERVYQPDPDPSALDDLSHTFGDWDGTDIWGRRVTDRQQAAVTVTWNYPMVYARPLGEWSFGRPIPSPFEVIAPAPGREFQTRLEYHTEVGHVDAADFSDGLAGWQVENHHTYRDGTIYYGSGEESSRSWPLSASAIGGGKTVLPQGGGPVPAHTADIGYIADVDVNDAGEILVLVDGGSKYDQVSSRVYLVDRSGGIRHVAGCTTGCANDWSEATTMQLAYDAYGIAWAHDQRSFYMAETSKNAVTVVDIRSGGYRWSVSYGGASGFSGDGGHPVSARLRSPTDIAIDQTGNMYIADKGNCRVRKVTKYGSSDYDQRDRITTFAGNPFQYSDPTLGDGGPAENAYLGGYGVQPCDGSYGPSDVDAAPDGSVIIADRSNYRVRRVGPDGVISSVAGCGGHSPPGCDFGETDALDGSPATSVPVDPGSVAIDSAGRTYFTDLSTARVRTILPDGTLDTEAGCANRVGPTPPPDCLAPEAGASRPSTSTHIEAASTSYAPGGGAGTGFAVAPQGDILIGAPGRREVGPNYGHVLQIGSAKKLVRTSAGETVPTLDFVDPTGTVIDSFGFDGKHMYSTDALSGKRIAEFGYDSYATGGTDEDGDPIRVELLTSIEDEFGRETKIHRGSDGTAESIENPWGDETILTVDKSDGRLTEVTTPEGRKTSTRYKPGTGLPVETVDHDGRSVQGFSYDELGLLTSYDGGEGRGYPSIERLRISGGRWGVRYTLPDGGGQETYQVGGGSSGPPTCQGSEEGSLLFNTTAYGAVTTRRTLGLGRTTCLGAPDGTTTSLSRTEHPRWGWALPLVASVTVEAAGGYRQQSTTSVTEVSLEDPADATSKLLAQTTATTELNQAGEPVATISTYVYDATGDESTITTTGPTGITQTTTLDGHGRPTRLTQPGWADTTIGYSDCGPTSVQEGRSVTGVGYNGECLPVSVQDPYGFEHVKEVDYDADGVRRTITHKSVHGTPPSTKETTTQLARHPDGTLASVTLPRGNKYSIAGYDDAGRPEQVVPPVRTGPDPSAPDLAAGTYFGWDARDRLTSVDTPAGETHTTTYAEDLPGTYETGSYTETFDWTGAKAQLDGITGPSGSTSLSAYVAGVPTKVDKTDNCSSQTTLSNTFWPVSYDRCGSGSQDLTWSDDGDLAKDGGRQLTYHPAGSTGQPSGLLSSITDADGTKTTYEYASEGWLEEMCVSYKSPVSGVDEPVECTEVTEFRNDGRPSRVEHRSYIDKTTTTHGFEYYADGRQKAITKNGRSEAAYLYDANGNVTSTEPGETRQYDWRDAMDYVHSTQSGGQPPSWVEHDADGRPKTKKTRYWDNELEQDYVITRSYHYDSRGLLERIEKTDPRSGLTTVEAELTYTTHNSTIKEIKKDGALWRKFQTDDEGRIVKVLDGQDRVVAHLFWPWFDFGTAPNGISIPGSKGGGAKLRYVPDGVCIDVFYQTHGLVPYCRTWDANGNLVKDEMTDPPENKMPFGDPGIAEAGALLGPQGDVVYDEDLGLHLSAFSGRTWDPETDALRENMYFSLDVVSLLAGQVRVPRLPRSLFGRLGRSQANRRGMAAIGGRGGGRVSTATVPTTRWGFRGRTYQPRKGYFVMRRGDSRTIDEIRSAGGFSPWPNKETISVSNDYPFGYAMPKGHIRQNSKGPGAVYEFEVPSTAKLVKTRTCEGDEWELVGSIPFEDILGYYPAPEFDVFVPLK